MLQDICCYPVGLFHCLFFLLQKQFWLRFEWYHVNGCSERLGLKLLLSSESNPKHCPSGFTYAVRTWLVVSVTANSCILILFSADFIISWWNISKSQKVAWWDLEPDDKMLTQISYQIKCLVGEKLLKTQPNTLSLINKESF